MYGGILLWSTLQVLFLFLEWGALWLDCHWSSAVLGMLFKFQIRFKYTLWCSIDTPYTPFHINILHTIESQTTADVLVMHLLSPSVDMTLLGSSCSIPTLDE